MPFLDKDEESLKIILLCVFQLEIHMPNEMPRNLVSTKRLNKIKDYSCVQHLWFNIEKIWYNEFLCYRFDFHVLFLSLSLLSRNLKCYYFRSVRIMVHTPKSFAFSKMDVLLVSKVGKKSKGYNSKIVILYDIF